MTNTLTTKMGNSKMFVSKFLNMQNQRQDQIKKNKYKLDE
jgi:hypothetical protein